MRVAVVGGTGFVGRALVPALKEKGWDVTVFGRRKPAAGDMADQVSLVLCDTTVPGGWQLDLARHEAVINLAGASIFRRWSKKGKALIMNSRLLTTANIVSAIGFSEHRAVRLLSVSGIGYYGSQGDAELREDAPPGNGFLATLAVAWEAAAMEARKHGAGVVVFRLGHVLGASGGMLPRLVSISRRHAGGYWGDGRQWVSWVGLEDVVSAFVWLLEHPDIQGPCNVTAPVPIRNVEMMRTLGESLGVKPLAPFVPGWFLRLATGEFASVFLGGQRVVPARLLEAGFVFRFNSFSEAVGASVSRDTVP